jgi:hypothetical protein
MKLPSDWTVRDWIAMLLAVTVAMTVVFPVILGSFGALIYGRSVLTVEGGENIKELAAFLAGVVSAFLTMKVVGGSNDR